MKRTQDFDPGTGAKFRQRTKRIINKDGSFNVKRVGARFRFNDAYLVFVRMKWWQFFATIFAGYLLVNIGFALLYMAAGLEGLSMKYDSQSEAFLKAFYFSTQTFTTVGYGAIAPKAHGPSIIASFEAMIGFLSFALATGLLFGRFSKPNARIRFSKHLLMHGVNGTRSLLFRVINDRPNHLMKLRATVMLVMSREEESGSVRRTYNKLNLQIDMIEFFPLSWTIVHPINDQSPLFGMSDEEILQSNGELLIHMEGFDEMFSQDVHQRFSYLLKETKTGVQFARPFETEANGDIVLNVDQIDATK